MAKVGDYVKIIKKLPYKDQMGVEIGDIGIVNYIASTGKYSVHIDGKKNPHDTSDQTQYGKLYGECGDFWIPFKCCEVIDNEKLTRQCLFENSDALDNCNITVSANNISFTDNYGCKFFTYTDNGTTTSNCKNYITQEGLDNYFNNVNKMLEREENKMKEILNQKVVDLYFKRKKDMLSDEFDAIRKAVEEIDNNHMFIKQLKDQFETYVETNEIKDVNTKIFPVLPLTEESKAKCEEAYDDYKKRTKELENLKEEIIAMLSGCETYEQEMVILRNYGIVDDNNKLVQTN